MAYIPKNFLQYVTVQAIRRRFYSKISFCKHSKSCIECCWLWKGYVGQTRYGSFYVCMLSTNPKKFLFAKPNRFMWTIVNGHTEKLVLHTCDTPLCVNYNHMFIGTQRDNVLDMIAKSRGRDSRGNNNPRAKLTPNTIWHMLTLRESGYTLKEIGSIVGVTESNVSSVLKGKTWKHLQL